MTKRPQRKIYAAGIIERHDQHFLIALPHTEVDGPRLWQFPRGLANPGESPEVCMRRMARETLALAIDIQIGQPPIVATIDGQEAELRFFHCLVAGGTEKPGSYEEVRWVSKAHLREYEFDDVSRPVAEWLLEE